MTEKKINSKTVTHSITEILKEVFLLQATLYILEFDTTLSNSSLDLVVDIQLSTCRMQKLSTYLRENPPF